MSRAKFTRLELQILEAVRAKGKASIGEIPESFPQAMSRLPTIRQRSSGSSTTLKDQMRINKSPRGCRSCASVGAIIPGTRAGRDFGSTVPKTFEELMAARMISIGTALWCCAAGSTLARPAAKQLTFGVANIKPAAQSCGCGLPCPIMVRFLPGGGLRVEGVLPKFRTGVAYNVRDSQITCSPVRMNSDRFDISARWETSDQAEAMPADPATASDDQRKTFGGRMQEPIRNLLADRLQLVLHRETKEQQLYAPVVGKGGPIFQQTKDGKGMVRFGPGSLIGQGVGMGQLATDISTQLRRPVIDKTGLTGKYDFELKWTPDVAQMPQGPLGPPPPGVQLPTPPDPDRPSISTAVQEQLGPCLESQKGPVQILVIERAEKPSENRCWSA